MSNRAFSSLCLVSGHEFVLDALLEPLGLPDGPTPDEVANAMRDSAIARAKLTVRFGR